MHKLFALIGISLLSVGGVQANEVVDSSVTAEQADVATALITSTDQLGNHLATTPSSPLYKLHPAARSHFVASLVFTPLGLGSFSYEDLAGLSVADAYRVLSLFGAQSTLSSIPGLTESTDLDRTIAAKAQISRNASGVVGPLADPRSNKVCVMGPEGANKCVSEYGHHCTDGCGG